MGMFNKKPQDWENVQAYSEYEALELGGHVCKIMKVEETKSKAGRDMIVISLDIAEGEQCGYFANKYKNDTRADKKWGCVVYQLIEDANGNTSRGFKTFIESVEKSNAGFNQNQIWNENFCNFFTGKLIGGVFGKEQYIASDGNAKFATKCRSFTTAEKARAGIPAPEDKLVEGQTTTSAQDPLAALGFVESPATDDIPFAL